MGGMPCMRHLTSVFKSGTVRVVYSLCIICLSRSCVPCVYMALDLPHPYALMARLLPVCVCVCVSERPEGPSPIVGCSVYIAHFDVKEERLETGLVRFACSFFSGV